MGTLHRKSDKEEIKMNDFEYKVSVIIPVYNAQQQLKQCLDSLVAQTIDHKQMEVLLINDGSTDQSLEICRKYEEQYTFFEVFSKENEGVSKTRNLGIANAHGKYIMYLDADDTISAETIKDVTDFFDKHFEEVDLVTYKELFVDGDEILPEHVRYDILNESGIYDLRYLENAYIMQTRLNICVKNLGEDNYRFEDSSYHEDQRYCTEIVLNKLKIGYCATGTYYYIYQPESIVRTRFYAYYIFEDVMEYWERLFSRFEKEVPLYVQALYMSDISWKTRTDILLPYHYSEEKLNHAKNRIIQLLNRISDEIILNHPNVDKFHRHFFISKKTNAKITYLDGPAGMTVLNQQHVILQEDKIEIVLCSFKVKENSIHIMAYLKSCIFSYDKEPELYLVKNRDFAKMEQIDLKESSWCHYRAKTKTNKFFLFHQKIDMNITDQFEFYVKMDGKLFKTKYYFMPKVYFSHRFQRYIYIKNGKKIEYSMAKFLISPAQKEDYKEVKKQMGRQFFAESRKVWLIRNLNMRIQSKKFDNIWLYHDCKGVKKDNGYYQFIHDFDKNDGVTRYFVVNDDFSFVKDQFTRKQRKYLVRFGSWKHKFLYLKARKIITAFIEQNNYMPFNEEWHNRYIDISNEADVYYLQHGVLHAHVPWKYSLDRMCIAKEVVSTQYEKENLIQNYCFDEEHLIESGMPRFDFIDENAISQNRILFAPSWRKYLVGMSDGEWVTIKGEFLQSDFYKKTLAFINSKELHDILEKYDFYLDFKLHPIFERYKALYQVTNDRVTMAENVIEDTEYSIFVTDFSSFSFDFVYLKKPILYFLPDDEMFRAGMNDYREIDLPFDKAFGELVYETKDAVSELEKILKNHCIPEEIFQKRMDHFFFYHDNEQRDRVYDAISHD